MQQSQDTLVLFQFPPRWSTVMGESAGKGKGDFRHGTRRKSQVCLSFQKLQCFEEGSFSPLKTKVLSFRVA